MVKQVSELVYLGYKLSASNDGTVAIKHRIGLGWAAFEKNKHILTSNRVPYHVKSKVYLTYVLFVVLYGLECANWTSKDEQAIEVFQNHIMRFMTNKKLIDHTKIEDLLEITKLSPVMPTIRSRCLKLFYSKSILKNICERVCIPTIVQT